MATDSIILLPKSILRQQIVDFVVGADIGSHKNSLERIQFQRRDKIG